MGNNNQQNQVSLEDFNKPGPSKIVSRIAFLEGTNFSNTPPALAGLIQQNQFSGACTDNLSLHLVMFNWACDFLKGDDINGYTKIRLFSFLLNGRAAEWYNNLDYTSITTWEKLAAAFLMKFYPTSLMEQNQSKLGNFAQQLGETLYTAWECFKSYQRECPHHDFTEVYLMDIFYRKLNQITKSMVNALANGQKKIPNDTRALFEELAHDNTNERDTTLVAGVNSEALVNLTNKVDQLLLSHSKPRALTMETCKNCSMLGHISTYYPFKQLAEKATSSTKS